MFLFLTLFTVGVAVYFRNPLLVYTAVFLVVTNAVLFVWAQYTVRGMKITRSHAQYAVAGRSIEVAIELVNNRTTPRYGTLGFDMHGELTPGKEYTPVAFLEAHPNQPVEAKFNMTPARRGVFEIGPFYLYGGDPFGFYKCWRKVEQRSELTVLPGPVEFTFTQAQSMSQLALDELETVPRPGESTEFMAVREYISGEPFKRVHWPTSARLGMLISRQYELNVAGSVSVMLLAEQDMLRGTKSNNPLECSMTMIASLAQATCRERFHFSYLALYGIHNEYAAGTGKRFSHELAIRLARFKGLGRVYLENQRRTIVNYLPERSNLIVFLANIDRNRSQLLKYLLTRFCSVSVVMPDLQSFDLSGQVGHTLPEVSTSNGFMLHKYRSGCSLRALLEQVMASVSCHRGIAK